ncbi:hypothetical protein GCM10007935_38720 [Hydrogenophaga electricum]|uniref:Uncharacterized protein n=1 Tax=Hydrogenophaga electricum TaxID=1230953 RepID=A0ABQ6C9U7_9BURK|nr:hypothetical protein GCM10007935_38720 [Hydrogenophaga electricum]
MFDLRSSAVSLFYLGGLGGPGYPVPLMSPETGFARFSSFTSLHRVPRSSEPEAMLARTGGEPMRSEKAVMGVCRSEVKEEGFVQQNPGDMSGGTHPSPPSQNKRQPSNGTNTTATNRRQAKWAK